MAQNEYSTNDRNGILGHRAGIWTALWSILRLNAGTSPKEIFCRKIAIYPKSSAQGSMWGWAIGRLLYEGEVGHKYILCWQGVEEIRDLGHGGPSLWDSPIPPPPASFCVLALLPSGSNRTTQTVQIPSPTSAHSIRQGKGSSLRTASVERAAFSDACSAQTALGQVASLNKGDHTSRSVWKSPHLPVVPA